MLRWILPLSGAAWLSLACADGTGPARIPSDAAVVSALAMVADTELWGDRLVARLDEPERDYGNRIVTIDLPSGRINTIHDDTLFASGHDVWADTIAWFDHRGLVVFDAGTGGARIYPEFHGQKLSVHDDRAVFEGGRGSETGIILVDLPTGASILVAERGGAPRLWGDGVVWVQRFRSTFLGVRTVIRRYDLDSGDTTWLANERTSLGDPAIGPAGAVWTEPVDSAGRHGLVGIDLRTGVRFASPPRSEPPVVPIVLRDHVAWLERRSSADSRSAVHLLDLATGRVERVSGWGVTLFEGDDERLLWWLDGRLFRLRP